MEEPSGKQSSREEIDDKGRLVRVTRCTDGRTIETYYIGRDAEGVIKVEGNLEYIEVNGQRRYWGGIINPLPGDSHIKLLNDFTVFIIKPDGMMMDLGKAMQYLIEQSSAIVVAKRDFIYDDATIRRMYPHFFAREWEKDLFEYLKSGPSRCLLVTGEHPHRKMLTVRNAVRTLFGCNGGPKVKSLVHCAQWQSTAIQQALLFFTLDEIVNFVGLKIK